MQRPAVFKIALVAIVLLCATGSAFAQAQKGDKEVKIAGSVSTFRSSSDSFGSSTTFNGQFQFGVGVFVTNGLEFGFEPGFSVSKTTGGGETTSTPTFRFGARQHFGRGRAAPYVGGNILLSKSTTGGVDSETQSFGGAEFGVKNYLSEKTALDLNLFVGTQLNKQTTPFGDISQTEYVFSIGITHLF